MQKCKILSHDAQVNNNNQTDPKKTKKLNELSIHSQAYGVYIHDNWIPVASGFAMLKTLC